MRFSRSVRSVGPNLRSHSDPMGRRARLLLVAACAACAACGAAHDQRHEPTDRKTNTKQLTLLSSGLRNGAASGLATIATKTMLQPFDTAKTLMQYSSDATPTLLPLCTQLVKNHGVLALYRGLGVNLVGAVPSMAAYFALYHAFRPALAARLRLPPLLLIAISASLANTFAATLRVPAELVKQRLQAGMYATPLSAFHSLWSAGGVAAFFPGGAVLAQLARDIPFGVALLISYESFKWMLRRSRKEGYEPPPWADAACGALAGAIGTILTNPMDVVKTRAMTMPGSLDARGAIALAAAILRDEGVAGFARGAVPRLLHKIPASAIFWLMYECLRRMFLCA